MAHTIVIFGASGDLTTRKLIPALYRLFRKKRLPEEARIVGFSRTSYSDDEWRAALAESTAGFTGDDFDRGTWDEFAKRVFYRPGDVRNNEDFTALRDWLDEFEAGTSCTRIYYLATAPHFYEPIVAQLGATGLADRSCGSTRVVIEKPIGTDLKTARALNDAVHQVVTENQVYRIDHYLGKETVQNILVFRFANTIFEPLWNRNYIDHVQITAAESVSVGRRADYFETAGVVRDMFQNHLLQLMAITAMEMPSQFESDLVRNEKAKLLQAIRRIEGAAAVAGTVRAQYRGYRDEPGVDPQSQVATFAAVKLFVDNWRWQGVPFYLRSGKAMNCRTTQIVVQFRQPPHIMFPAARRRPPEANRVVIHIQPAEGIQILFQTKVPDAGMKLRETHLDFRFSSQFENALPDAYERLLLDVFSGDQSLFARSDEVELAWGIVDPILAAWNELGLPDLAYYARDTWGPTECQKWIWADDREWLDACPVLK